MNALVRIPERAVSIAWREQPFVIGSERCHVIRPLGRMPTIAEIIETAPLSDRLRAGCIVCVNGDQVPREMWPYVRPRPGKSVTIHHEMGSWLSSFYHHNEDLVRTIATIGLLVATIAATAFLGPITGPVWAGIIGAGIGIAGSLAIAALIPPPTLSANQAQPTALPGLSGSGVVTTSSGSSAALSGNVLAPGAAAPRVVGTIRVYPPLLCNPLVEVIGKTEVVEAVFGLAGPHAIPDSSIWLGTTPINTMPQSQADWEVQEGWQSSPTQTLVIRQSYTLTPSIALKGHLVLDGAPYELNNQTNPALASPQWAAFASRNGPDEIWINLAWTSGLYQNSSPNSVINMPVRVRIKRRGDVSWINMPEVHFSSNSPTPFQKVIRIKWGSPPPPPPPPTAGGPIFAFKHIPAQDGVTIIPAIGGWDADSSFSAGAGNDYMANGNLATTNVKNTELRADKVIFYLDPNVFPQDNYYDLQAMIGSPYLSGSFAPATFLYTNPGGVAAGSYVIDFFQYYQATLASPTYWRIALDQSTIQEAAGITRVSSIWNQNPVQTKDYATVSIKVTGQSVGSLSVLASGYVPDWDGTGWTNWTATSNPAPHARDILGGTQGSQPLPADLIDDTSLVAWRTQCINQGYTCNTVLEGKTYIDGLNVVTSSGYARLRHCEKWGVFFDKDRSADTPVQIFTPRNMANFSWTRAFGQLPTGFRAAFNDASLDYVQNQIIVLDPTVDQTAFTQFEQIQYDGLVNAADITARALFDLKQARLRFTFYTGTTDIENIVCQRGDLVGVQNDILTNQAGFARIKSITKSGGNVTGVVLDGSVPMPVDAAWLNESSAWLSFASAWSATKTGAVIRYLNQTVSAAGKVTATDSLDPTSQLTFSTPFADPGSVLAPDCLCAIGPLGSETRRLIVYGITYKPDLTATVTFVDEAPQLWQ